MKRLACLLAIVLAGCGAAAVTKTSTRASTSAGHLTTAERASINQGVRAFNQASGQGSRLMLATAATDEASRLTAIAAHHTGTLAQRLLAASQAWLRLSATALHGTPQAALAAKDRAAEALHRLDAS